MIPAWKCQGGGKTALVEFERSKPRRSEQGTTDERGGGSFESQQRLTRRGEGRRLRGLASIISLHRSTPGFHFPEPDLSSTSSAARHPPSHDSALISLEFLSFFFVSSDFPRGSSVPALLRSQSRRLSCSRERVARPPPGFMPR